MDKPLLVPSLPAILGQDAQETVGLRFALPPQDRRRIIHDLEPGGLLCVVVEPHDHRNQSMPWSEPTGLGRCTTPSINSARVPGGIIS